MSSVEGKETDKVRRWMLPDSHCSCTLPTPPACSHPVLAVMHCPMHIGGSGGALQPPPAHSSWVLTLLDAKAAGPLLQGDVLVVVQVAGLEEASGAVLHGDQGGTQRGQLRVGQVPARVTTPSQQGRCWPQLSALAAVPVPSQDQPPSVTRVKGWSQNSHQLGVPASCPHPTGLPV